MTPEDSLALLQELGSYPFRNQEENYTKKLDQFIELNAQRKGQDVCAFRFKAETYTHSVWRSRGRLIPLGLDLSLVPEFREFLEQHRKHASSKEIVRRYVAIGISKAHSSGDLLLLFPYFMHGVIRNRFPNPEPATLSDTAVEKAKTQISIGMQLAAEIEVCNLIGMT